MTIRNPKLRSNFCLALHCRTVEDQVLNVISDQLVKVSPFSVNPSRDSATVYLYCEDDVNNDLAKSIQALIDGTKYNNFTMSLKVLNGENVIETIAFSNCSLGDVKVGGFDYSSSKPDDIAEEIVLGKYNKDLSHPTILNRIAVRYGSVSRKFAQQETL